MNATTKKANASKAVVKANENALKGFPKAKLTKCMDLIAGNATEIEKQQTSKAGAAFEICKLAQGFAAKNSEATTETIVKGYDDNWKLLALELAIAGNKFAELKKGKDDKPDTATMTGYGRNVKSIARGVIEFEIDPCNLTHVDEDGNETVVENDSYREVRKSVEACRANARRISDPDTAAFNDAVDSLDTGWATLRKLVLDQSDTGLVTDLEDMLTGIIKDVQDQLDAQAKIEAEAKASDEAVAETAEAIDEGLAEAEAS